MRKSGVIKKIRIALESVMTKNQLKKEMRGKCEQTYLGRSENHTKYKFDPFFTYYMVHLIIYYLISNSFWSNSPLSSSNHFSSKSSHRVQY
jgi:hypothetical protein